MLRLEWNTKLERKSNVHLKLFREEKSKQIIIVVSS